MHAVVNLRTYSLVHIWMSDHSRTHCMGCYSGSVISQMCTRLASPCHFDRKLHMTETIVYLCLSSGSPIMTSDLLWDYMIFF